MARQFCPMPEPKRWRWPRFGIRTLLVLVAVVALFAWVASWIAYPNRIVIRNAGGSDVKDVRIWISDLKGNVVYQTWVSRLKTGSSTTISHGLNDLAARLTFQVNGAEREFENGYIDLWTGEGWVFEIQRDGSIKEGYDIPDLPLR